MTTTIDNVRAADMEYLFSALNHAASPIVVGLLINIAGLAASRGAVVKTTGGRVKAIAKRYGLEITTTTKGEVNGVVATPTPVKDKGVGGRKRKVPVGKSNGKAKGSTKEVNGEGDEEEVEDEAGSEDLNPISANGKSSSPDEETPPAKRAKLSSVKVEQEDDSDGEDAAAEDEDGADEELA